MQNVAFEKYSLKGQSLRKILTASWTYKIVENQLLTPVIERQ